jgi:hypothetical protein
MASAAQTPTPSPPSAGPPPWPDDDLTYVSLPASGDDGFPQAFLLQFAGVVYRLTITVYYPDPDYVFNQAYANTFFDLPDPVRGLYLNLKVEIEALPAPARLVGARRVVLAMPMVFGPLCFLFTRARVAQANLTGPGSYGSELIAEVAVANV